MKDMEENDMATVTRRYVWPEEIISIDEEMGEAFALTVRAANLRAPLAEPAHIIVFADRQDIARLLPW